MTMVAEQDQGQELPERWSAKAKTDVVLRLMRGEGVEVVSREVQVPAHELEAWRRCAKVPVSTSRRRLGCAAATWISLSGFHVRGTKSPWGNRPLLVYELAMPYLEQLHPGARGDTRGAVV